MYPPSTIHRYMDLPSTHIIQTHVSHKHTTNPTPPDKSGKDQTNPLIHSNPSTPTPSRANPYTSHTLHQLLSCIAPPLHYTQYPNHVYHPHVMRSPQPHLIHPPEQHCRHPRTLKLSQHTHMQHKQQYTHHSHSHHHINIGYHDNLTYRPKTTT